MSSPRNRSWAVRRFSTCESGYSGCERTVSMEPRDSTRRGLALSMRFVPREPSNCHLKRRSRGCTSGCSARRGFGRFADAETDCESLPAEGMGLFAWLNRNGRVSRRALGRAVTHVQVLQCQEVDEGGLELGDARIVVRVERLCERLRPAKRLEFL